MARLSYVDPRLLKPPSRSLLGAVEMNEGAWDWLTSWFSDDEPKAPTQEAKPQIPTYPTELPDVPAFPTGELTIDQAASGLIAARTRMSSAWPLLKKKASEKNLTYAEMAVWNGAQWALVDMEMRLARRLVELGAKTEDGKTITVPTPDELQQRMQVGRFAGVPNATLGYFASPAVVMWALSALGVLLGGAVALWIGSQAVKAFSAEELSKLEIASKLVDCVAQGTCDQASLTRLKDLNIEPDKGRLPGWAKGVIAIGAVVVGTVLVVNLAPLLKSKRA